MKKQELIDEVAGATGQTKVAVRSVLDATSDVVQKSLQRGEPVFLMGLGKLTRRARKARLARNIHTNAAVQVPAHDIAYFEPSQNLNRLLNQADHAADQAAQG